MSFDFSSLRQDLDCNGMDRHDLDQAICDAEYNADMLMMGNDPNEFNMDEADNMTLAEFMD